MHRWRQFKALGPAERRALVAACVQLPLIGLALRLLGFSRARALLAGTARAWATPPDGSAALAVARRHALAIGRAAHHGPYRAPCLEQSMLLWSRLHRKGMHADLRIGVRKDGGRLAAHAWVEYRGDVLNDRVNVGERFAAFAEPLARTRRAP